LLDVNCDETTTKSLVASVTGNFHTDELVHEVEQRNRVKLILTLLETRVPSGSQDPPVFNAMVKNDFHQQQSQSRDFLEGEQRKLRYLASELDYLRAYSFHSCMSCHWSSGS